MNRSQKIIEEFKVNEGNGYNGQVVAKKDMMYNGEEIAKGHRADASTEVDRKGTATVRDTKYGTLKYKSEKEMLKDWKWDGKQKSGF